MDINPLTPNKIQRLIHLAEDRSFNFPRRLLLNDEDLSRLASHPAAQDKSGANTNTSSGIIDLERVEGFGDSLGNLSLSKSTAFNPGEMTGRSTGAQEMETKLMSTTQTLDQQYGRHSIALDSITNEMDRQTTEVHDILRHSIATDFSFHSKRDLTADESSFIKREAVLPVPTNQRTNITESMVSNNTSMGAYFQNRCPDFGKILGKTDSPDRSYAPSISEVSASYQMDPVGHSTHYKMDHTLDSVPVKQPRIPDNVPEKSIVNNLNNTKTLEKKNNLDHKKDIQNVFSGNLEKQDNTKVNKLLEKPMLPLSYNTMNHKSMINMATATPSDILIRNLEHSMRLVQEDTDGDEPSLSISKIQDFLGRQSSTNVRVSDMLKLNKKKTQPLTELQNIQECKPNNEVHVTLLKDTKSLATASTAGSINTVISVDKKTNINEEVPAVFVTADTLSFNELKNALEEDVKEKLTSVRSRSPSTQSTLTTVQDNYSSFKASNSPLHTSRGDAHIPSPNSEYKELDKSVNWHELLRHRHLRQSLAKEQWADITATVANGYVGVSCPVTVTTTILTETWLTAKFQFDELPDDGKNLTIELPRFPILLAPGKDERFTLHITSNVEMSTSLPFTMFLKDASIDLDVIQKGSVAIDIKMPVIQAMSSDGVNKVTFPPIQEKTVLTKAFVLLSDCEVDLQLDLSVVEGDSLFAIKNVQEIKKCDVNKVLMDRQGSTEEAQGKGKGKILNKQLCRLSSGNAIRVTITFKAPKLSDIQIPDAMASFNGALNVNLYGLNTTLRKVDLIASVGSVNLVVQTGVTPETKLELTHEPTKITLTNTGTIPGMWFVKFAMANVAGHSKIPFKISPSKFDIRPGESKTVGVAYTGPEDCITEAILAFEEVSSGNKTKIEICGGSEKLKIFPVKSNHNVLSWVRPGRKELSMRNVLDKKIQIRCHITGDGFAIDLPGGELKGIYLVSFSANECRPLPILFNPSSNSPQNAVLHLVHDKNSEFSRAIRLYGCAGGAPARWSGLVTYGDTALVRAAARRRVELALYNKAPAPAFVCATVHFNLQFMFATESSQLEGARSVVGPRSKHVVKLALDWGRVERRARDCAGSALATVTVLCGAEVTRRRILRVLRNESGAVDADLLPAHLQALTDQYEGEDPSIDEQLAHFNETKSSLNELLSGLHELTAQIDLPQDFTDENTIVITDDTVVEHHTLLD
ncbi:uncharacterized protein LOC106134308 isoform X1 [Amyelois transitella]|uniref:uncharacterized protein LOC106134308 isoform X1 n=1 Tax=Amyelois transitella TaxID=680683 RepID=UPI00298FC97E|nr:uncharacterized protein LOC106134308 isoform X1 [Amyelois transitella]XP_013189775.2 uncharacterized protein LOC106134308 isoform X1 [Amyelois transitella]XP_013189776.2 uncharacterized protein LOC106134308 isoform X1 [Amyelois transitella]